MKKLKAFIARQETLLGLLICGLVIVMSIMSDRFLRLYNLMEMTRNFTEIGIIALPMTMIIITGGIDLSVESIVALAAIMFGWTFDATKSIPMACGAAVLAGGLAGILNGIIIGRYRIPPLVATLATMYVYRGLALGISTGRSYTGYPESFYFLGQGNVGVLPTQLIAYAILIVVAAIFLGRTYPGRFLFAMGYNEQASLFSGVRTRKMKYFLYTASGLVASLSAIIFVSRISTAKANAGAGFTFDAVTAVLLGGTSISGGSGSVIGTTLAMIAIGILRNGLTLARFPNELQSVIIGAVLIVSVISNNSARKTRGQ